MPQSGSMHQVVAKAFKQWELVEIELQDRAKDGEASKSGEPSAKKKTGPRVGKKTKTDLKPPSPVSGVVNKTTPLDSLIRGRRGAATVERARAYQAPERKVKAQEQEERRPELTVNDSRRLLRRERAA